MAQAIEKESTTTTDDLDVHGFPPYKERENRPHTSSRKRQTHYRVSM